MTGRAVIFTTLLLTTLLSTSGCLRLVSIRDRQITPLTERDVPLATTPDGNRVIKAAISVRGTTEKFEYNSTLWRFARMPCIRSQAGFLVMLDTGMDAPARATLDVIAAQKYPAVVGDDVDFAWVPSLSFGGIAFSNLLVLIETNVYEAQFLGLPLYRANGMVLGMASLRAAKYLAFDNERREVTIGLEKFAPTTNRTWESFRFVADPERGLVARPYVDLPIAGQPVRL